MKHIRLFLRPVKVSDAPLLARWFNDKENIKYMSTVVRCKKHSPRGIRQNIRQSDPEYERQFMVCLKQDKKPIGHAGIDELDFYDRRGEIFFLIGNKKEQGQGYGREILALLLEYAFDKLHLNSLLATATVENIPSLRALRRAGFKKVGLRREYNYINGRFKDEIFLDLTAKDYRVKHKKK